MSTLKSNKVCRTKIWVSPFWTGKMRKFIQLTKSEVPLTKSLHWLDRRVQRMHPAAGWIGGINVGNLAIVSNLKPKIMAAHGGLGTNQVIKRIQNNNWVNMEIHSCENAIPIQGILNNDNPEFPPVGFLLVCGIEFIDISSQAWDESPIYNMKRVTGLLFLVFGFPVFFQASPFMWPLR